MADSLTVEYVDLSSEAYQAVVDARNARLYVTTSDGLTRLRYRCGFSCGHNDRDSRATDPQQRVGDDHVERRHERGPGSGRRPERRSPSWTARTYQVTTIPVPGVANRAMAGRHHDPQGITYPTAPASSLTIVGHPDKGTGQRAAAAMPNRIAINESNGKHLRGARSHRGCPGDRPRDARSLHDCRRIDSGRGYARHRPRPCLLRRPASVLVVDGNIATPISAASYGMAVRVPSPRPAITMS
jgi:hypothetical protein